MEEVQEEESVQDRHSSMSRIEKMAIDDCSWTRCFITLLKRFDSKDAENICKKIGDFPIVDQTTGLCLDYFPN